MKDTGVGSNYTHFEMCKAFDLTRLATAEEDNLDLHPYLRSRYWRQRDVRAPVYIVWSW